ncbi:transposase [Rhodovulum sulfidophilum]|uniref:Transposase n=1 Tax=Rhodovulum sulfidophilum TaxID=35806 RepID=A0A0D6AX28_RHOSU|nr:transposase [Rhodovulum sulfidophilum]
MGQKRHKPEEIVARASQYGRYGYRRVAALAREMPAAVNVKRVERIWRREGLKAPRKRRGSG